MTLWHMDHCRDLDFWMNFLFDFKKTYAIKKYHLTLESQVALSTSY